MDALATLLEQAEAQRNTALAAFNHTRARRDAAREQSTQLDSYRSEHEQRWQAQLQHQGAGVDIVRMGQQFGARLDDAIAQQAHALAVCEAALARADDTLAAHELRLASVRKLIERRAQQVQQVTQRRENKASDEMALRMAMKRQPTLRNGA